MSARTQDMFMAAGGVLPPVRRCKYSSKPDRFWPSCDRPLSWFGWSRRYRSIQHNAPTFNTGAPFPGRTSHDECETGRPVIATDKE
jgi:hypothetical protein